MEVLMPDKSISTNPFGAALLHTKEDNQMLTLAELVKRRRVEVNAFNANSPESNDESTRVALSTFCKTEDAMTRTPIRSKADASRPST
jgi:hypothetical protein